MSRLELERQVVWLESGCSELRQRREATTPVDHLNGWPRQEGNGIIVGEARGGNWEELGGQGFGRMVHESRWAPAHQVMTGTVGVTISQQLRTMRRRRAPDSIGDVTIMRSMV